MEKQPYRPGLWVSLLVPAYSVGFMRSNRTGPSRLLTCRATRGTETLAIRFSFLGFAFVPCQMGFKCWPVATSHTGNYFWRMRSLPLRPVFFCFHWCVKQLLTGPERRLCYEHWWLAALAEDSRWLPSSHMASIHP